jgi:hypothetical protein
MGRGRAWAIRMVGVLFFSASFISFGYKFLGFTFLERTLPKGITPGFTLQEVSHQAGLEFTHHNNDHKYLVPFGSQVLNIEPYVEAVGASVAVVDIDGDGWPDIFLNSTEPGTSSKMFRNNHDGTFTDIAPQLGLQYLDFADRALFFDCDNDGKPELFLTTDLCPRLLKQNSEGRYVDLPFPSVEGACGLTTAANVIDANRDGLLDVVIASIAGWPGQYPLPANAVTSTTGGRSVLFRNTGSCRFVLDTSLFKETDSAIPHAIGVGDLRGTGRDDMWFAIDFNEDRVYTADGETYTKFTQGNRRTLSHAGMSAEFSYLFDQDKPFVFVSNVFEPGYLIGGNMLWHWENGVLVESAKSRGLERCGWAWGAHFVDLNNDSHDELIVANGFISGKSPKDYWFSFTTLQNSLTGFMANPKHWPSMNGISFSGHQQDCVFLNTGNEFYDIAPQLGFDLERKDGRGVASIDYLNNGQMSLVVANQKQSAELYRNQVLNSNGWIGFDLVGDPAAKSNRDAIGSKVRVELNNGRVLRKELQPFNGYASQSDRRLHFGLGTAEIAKITVTWPNGDEIELPALAPNRYHTIQQNAIELTRWNEAK